MASFDTLVWALRNPRLAARRIRGSILVGGVRRDPECMHLVYAWSSGGLARVPITEVFPGIEQVESVWLKKPEARRIGYSLDLQELVHLLGVVKLTNAKSILEIGTYDGFTALNIAANVDAGGMVYTVDLPPERDAIAYASDPKLVGSKFIMEPECERIRQLWADSTKADWQDFGGIFDLILIDGCHEYRYVKSDSENAIRHIRPGGTILWHDYGQMLGVSKALDELSRMHNIVAIRGTRMACLRDTTDPVLRH
jgi:SAM-dependent methyltransferase